MCPDQEVLRIKPVLPMLFRRAMKDVQIGQYLIPEGTIIELHMLAMNTHPLYWDCPDEFLPVNFPDPLKPPSLALQSRGCSASGFRSIEAWLPLQIQDIYMVDCDDETGW